MMRNLEVERLTLAAMSLGIADRCLEIMVRHAQERKAFGQPILGFGQVQRYIGESFAMTEAARALVYNVARDIGPDRRNNAAAAKALVEAEAAVEVADPPALSAALAKLFADPAWRGVLASNARGVVAQHEGVLDAVLARLAPTLDRFAA